VLEVEKLAVGYGDSLVLRDVSLTVKPGQVVCLMGRNGVGKTTLMRGIMGLLKAKRGTIRYNGADMTRLPPDRRAKAGIGYVPQGREIFSQLTVEDNLRLGLEALNGRPPRQIPDRVFELFPVLREMLHRRGGDLSGGQQQQLAIARALVARPTLLLLDEPMEGIQPSVVQLIEDAIASIKAARDTAVLLVEQSLEFAAAIADYYYVLDKGTVVAEGGSAELSAEDVKLHLTV
jgi:urea transport system ATP-binding protein